MTCKPVMFSDYYKVLGVKQNASIPEIKSAFRKKAKRLHPDMQGGGGDRGTIDEFNLIKSAYDALLKKKEDQFLRDFTDAKNYQNTNDYKPFNYHDYLMFERTDFEAKAKLIFFDLLHAREDEAVFVYLNMTKSHANFLLSYWFPKEDFMDLGYILCEELEAREEYYDAIVLLEEIIKLEREKRYFKGFFSEVIKFTWGILKKNIDKVLSDELALDVWERALEMGLSPERNLFILKKMALCYKRIGDEELAAYYDDLSKKDPFVLKKILLK